MRLIDADELLKKAHDIVFKYPDGVEYRHRCVDPDDIVTAPTVEPTETEIQEVLNKRCMTAVANEYLIAILGGKTQGEWIPVSERLPERANKPYLVTLDYDELGLCVGHRFYFGDGIGWDNPCVIAWQPLPEPYNKEAENDKYRSK